MKKLNNKGFSMVELIIVIAIMAILVGAIAPTLIKYIKKSRRSADLNNGQTIASAVQEAAANPDAADKMSTHFSSASTLVPVATLSNAGGDAFQKEFHSILGVTPKSKLKSGDFYVAYDAANNSVKVYVGNATTDEVYPDATGDYASN